MITCFSRRFPVFFTIKVLHKKDRYPIIGDSNQDIYMAVSQVSSSALQDAQWLTSFLNDQASTGSSGSSTADTTDTASSTSAASTTAASKTSAPKKASSAEIIQALLLTNKANNENAILQALPSAVGSDTVSDSGMLSVLQDAAIGNSNLALYQALQKTGTVDNSNSSTVLAALQNASGSNGSLAMLQALQGSLASNSSATNSTSDILNRLLQPAADDTGITNANDPVLYSLLNPTQTSDATDSNSSNDLAMLQALQDPLASS